jgi:hypothetical protein
VQKQYGGPIARPGFSIGSAQQTGIDLLQRAEHRVGSGFDRWQRGCSFGGLSIGQTDVGEVGRGNSHNSGADQVSAIAIDFD